MSGNYFFFEGVIRNLMKLGREFVWIGKYLIKILRLVPILPPFHVPFHNFFF